MSDVDVDEPEAMDDSAEDPVEPGDEEGDENDNPNRQQNPECNDAPEPTDEDAESSEKAERLHKFPLGRIKNIMKQDPDTNMASQEAVFLISRATELFVESLAAESSSFTMSNKKKTIARTDVDAAIDAVDCLAFLDGALND